MPKKKKSIHTDHPGKTPQKPEKGKSTALLDLEADGDNCSASSIESRLLFCKRDDFMKARVGKSGECSNFDEKPNICAVPKSDVLGKVKGFLGAISEANKKLQGDAKGDLEKYDIEVLNGNETEVIEMDLMLGVADLHTPEAFAAAESAMASYQPTISLAAGESSDDDDDEDGDGPGDHGGSDNEDGGETDDDEMISNAASGSSSCEEVKKRSSKKRPKIVELS